MSIYLVRQAKEHGQAVDPESEEHKNVVQTIFDHEVRTHTSEFIVHTQYRALSVKHCSVVVHILVLTFTYLNVNGHRL